ncbi:MAG: energy transducer TonB [Candidatus Aminicenantales bacterium]
MGKAKIFILVLSLVLCISCAEKARLPIKTSLGDLTKIENWDKVTTDEGIISPNSEEIVYVLSFECKNLEFEEIEILDAANVLPKLVNLTLVDSKGNEFTLVFFGSPTREGALSNKEIRFDGALRPKNGKWFFTGKLIVPESKLALVYVVPKNASGLALKDGEKKYRIEPEMLTRPAPPTSFITTPKEPSSDIAKSGEPQIVSTDILNKNAIYRASPNYPPQAKAAQISGTVRVEIVVDEGGNVVSAHALNGLPFFQEAAVEAAEKWKFKPFLNKDRPIKVSGILEFNFAL